MEKAYRRIFLHTVKRYLDEMGVPFFWVGVDRKFSNFNDYRDYLGRSLVFFNPTWQSPRPRARTEAMLSGACIVTTPYHDANTFIEDGVNGFLTGKGGVKDPRIMDNPRYAADLIKRLVLDEPELAMKVGQEGKKTAIKLFNTENFTKQWGEVLKEIGVI
jgi:glycosyltransferase involved in cell wall biosynthesis